jgi:hypothetical protein
MHEDAEENEKIQSHLTVLHSERNRGVPSAGSALWANSGECGHFCDWSGAEVYTYCY